MRALAGSEARAIDPDEFWRPIAAALTATSAAAEQTVTAVSAAAEQTDTAAASAAASTAVRWQSDIGGALAPVILALDNARPSHRWLREQITIPQKEAITLASIFRIAMMVGLWQGDPDPNLSADYRASGLESLAAYVDSFSQPRSVLRSGQH